MPGNVRYPHKVCVPRELKDAIKLARDAGEFAGNIVIEDIGDKQICIECSNTTDTATIAARTYLDLWN